MQQLESSLRLLAGRSSHAYVQCVRRRTVRCDHRCHRSVVTVILSQRVGRTPSPSRGPAVDAIEINDSRCVAALEGVASAMLASAARTDEAIAAEFGGIE